MTRITLTTSSLILHISIIFLLSLSFASAASTNETTANDDNQSGRIVLGKAFTRSYPFFAVAAPLINCGGILVHHDMLLTAAHCHPAWDASTTRMVLVDNRTAVQIRAAKDSYKLDWKAAHPQYVEKSFQYDVALYRLSSRVPDATARLAKLTLQTDEPFSSEGAWTILGFGKTREIGIQSEYGQEAVVQLLPQRQCKDHYTTRFFPDSQCCASGSSSDACQGDSGGPAMYVNPRTGQFQVGGIISWGDGCGTFPGVYTRLWDDNIHEFIETTVCACSRFPPEVCTALQLGATCPGAALGRSSRPPPSPGNLGEEPGSTPAPSLMFGREKGNTMAPTRW